MDKDERDQARTDRNLDWLSEWKKVAEALRELTGQDWSATMQEDGWHPRIELHGNVPLYAKPHPDSQNRNKAFVSVDVPNELRGHEPYDADNPSIGLTYTKGPEKVARDIQRRLLQDAADYHLDLITQKRKDEQKRKRKNREINLIEEQIGVDFRSSSGASPKAFLMDLCDEGHGNVRQLESGSYKLMLEGLDAETLLDILHALDDS
jgi:hypothetical protein